MYFVYDHFWSPIRDSNVIGGHSEISAISSSHIRSSFNDSWCHTRWLSVYQTSSMQPSTSLPTMAGIRKRSPPPWMVLILSLVTRGLFTYENSFISTKGSRSRSCTAFKYDNVVDFKQDPFDFPQIFDYRYIGRPTRIDDRL